MSYDPYTDVKFSAFDVALKAQVNDLSQHDVDEMRIIAERFIDSAEDPLRRAVIGFVTQYELHRADRDVLHRLGKNLSDFISNLNMPIPPGQERRDIHG